jgi:uncharacterized protein YndB with AHSA1/START domain
MTVNTVTVSESPDRVFDALLDPRTYPEWLVGARRIRKVEPDWPEVGSRFHHSIGVGRVRVRDSTSVMELDRPRCLRLRAGMGVLGAAEVTFHLSPVEDGTEVRIDETPFGGPVRLMWWLARPIVAAMLWGRNAVSLDTFRELVEAGEGRTGSY